MTVVSFVTVRRLDLDQSCDASAACVSIHEHIQTYVNDATLFRTRGHELIFTLPLTSADKFAGQFCYVNNK